VIRPLVITGADVRKTTIDMLQSLSSSSFICLAALRNLSLRNVISFAARLLGVVRRPFPLPSIIPLPPTHHHYRHLMVLSRIPVSKSEYSTFFVRVVPAVISLRLCTPKVVGV
jgi:hypothetical protein